ncbi:hypothetical protein ABPG74_018049 [Tetrahymena malaccensis]
MDKQVKTPQANKKCRDKQNCKQGLQCNYIHSDEDIIYFKNKKPEFESNKIKNVRSQYKYKPPQYIYYQNSINQQNQDKNLPKKSKCHFYDLFGKCDGNNCEFQHFFEPQFKCSDVKEGKPCSQVFPKYTKNKLKYNCNEKKYILNCHQYMLEGTCQIPVCTKIHKQVLKKCPMKNCKICALRKQQISNKTQIIQDYFKKNFKFNIENLKDNLKFTYEVTEQQRKEKQFYQTFDLMFIVDCTSSINLWIKFVKDKIKSITESVQKVYSSYLFRYSFICYRDYDVKDDENADDINFSSDIERFKEHVSKIQAKGGDDIPEDMISGLSKGLQQSFESNVKAVFLIFDAPSHGKNYHEDNIPDNDPEPEETIEEFIQQYAEKNIYMGLLMLGRKKLYTAQKTNDAILNEYKRNEKNDYIYQLQIDSGYLQPLNAMLQFHGMQNQQFITPQTSNQVEQYLSDSIIQSIRHTQSIQQNPIQNIDLIDNLYVNTLKEAKIIEIKPINQYISNFDFPIQWENPFIVEEESSYTYQIELLHQINKNSEKIEFKALDKVQMQYIIIKFDLQISNNPEINLSKMKDQLQCQITFIISFYFMIFDLSSINETWQCVRKGICNTQKLQTFYYRHTAGYAQSFIPHPLTNQFQKRLPNNFEQNERPPFHSHQQFAKQIRTNLNQSDHTNSGASKESITFCQRHRNVYTT